MNDRPPRKPDRRRFLQTTLGLGASASLIGGRALGDEPRAISGDRIEPSWESLLSVTIGPRDADIIGASDKALQAAVDFISQRGGGTIKITPGAFRLRNAVYLPSRVRLLGSGPETILTKEPSTTTKLAASSDWYDQEVTLADAGGFQVGDGVCFRAKNPDHGGPVVIKRTLVGRTGARFKLDKALRENLWLKGEPTASTLFPLISCENVSDVVIENLALDGNRANNANLDGNYAGCIFAQDCSRLTFRDVIARNNNGDGLSWQICHDVLVERCTSHDHAGLGLHPGSGSQRPIMRDNRVMRNNIGIFFCWGVRFGLAERNTIEDIATAGVSIGHRDTDNVVRDNTIVRSGKVGVLFRDESHEFAAHRNRFENNTIVDSGPADGIGIDVQGQTESVTLTRNQVRETRQPMSRIGIRLGPKTKTVDVVDNRVEGFARQLADLRTS
ncbi:MAG: right-handed parallel beta-helix repeat-containing protein [Paludisphaera borealis]|uniref:right-handed parallel beta-helix repeat-containing protein n=1 Tax=Paludisphaera borealis TaxID=1387353 RepID=UPI0028522AD1|nr:right-handed parallel beta-helix repeat-containing protein [Paludisphaera borealis]MDR3623097.1 right-handed parallel beta-helix repeat-containing protein [Paludisphaera borealis]